MLGMKKYSREYIDACRARVDGDLRAYRKQVGGASAKEFESRFFNAQVLLLDHMFVHRLTGVEGKDGNPLNEVRVLCNSLLYNKGKVQMEKLPDWPNSAGASLKLPPDKSVLGLENGDDIRLSEADFTRLAKAFFAEIEKRYL
ncbi:MAG TPA: hypothetical protein VE935_23765 [Burkholderiales bacterium]|jgi:hypothetical protein|nr:hypothetical protein [Burkholderiales bacterium]